MKEITDIIELQTNDIDKKLIFYTRYLVQINFTFDLAVISNGFKGTSHFCVRKDEIESFYNNLYSMHQNLAGISMLQDNDSDGYIKFEFNDFKQLQVSGQIGGSHEDHFMKFSFTTDQTVIPQFVNDFKKLSTNTDSF
ncbi:MAG: WapI family immunity protein [Bacteroidia bacterium]